MSPTRTKNARRHRARRAGDGLLARAGKGLRAALDATAATVGRAIVAVAIAVVGSVTVLPAALAVLGATYGVLDAIFHHDRAQSPLGFTSTGTASDWVALFAFVILLGLLAAAVALLGDRRWRVSPRPAAARDWEDARAGAAATAAMTAPASGHAR